MSSVLMMSFLLGCVAGLRSITAPAGVSWAAHFGWLRLVGTRLAFTSHPFTLVVVTVLALFELIADKLPRTPARTAPVGLIARVFFGGACGLALATSSRTNPLLNMAAAATGSVLAAFIGYNTRRIVGLRLHVQDFATAIAEDAVAITGAYLVLSHV